MNVSRRPRTVADQQPGLTRAEAKFESAQKAARKIRESEDKTTHLKTERLRALRLAKEAGDQALANAAMPAAIDE